jgi:ketosteroid isomerase-like protein
MTRSALIPAAVLLCGCGLHRRPPAPEPARGPARDSLFLLDQTRADSVTRRGPVDGMLALLSPDVVYLRAGVPAVYGREAARAIFAAAAERGEPSSSLSAVAWEPLGGSVSYDLQSAHTYGIAARAVGGTPNSPAPTTAIHLERYIAFWQRTRGQPWRIAAYAEVGSPPAVELRFTAEHLTPPRRPPPRALADAVAAVRAADSLFSDLADRRGVADAFSNTVAPDGVIFGPSRLVIGPAAVREYYTAQGTGTALTWRPVYAAVAGSRDLGFTIGEYTATGRGPSGAAVQRFGKYLTVWQRQPDGTWKFVVDGGNATPARATDR